jgi:hypothetical protein
LKLSSEQKFEARDHSTDESINYTAKEMECIKNLMECDHDFLPFVLKELMKLLKLKVYLIAGGMLYFKYFYYVIFYGVCCHVGQRLKGYQKVVDWFIFDNEIFSDKWNKMDDFKKNIFPIKLYFGGSFQDMKIISRTLNLKSMNINISPYVLICFNFFYGVY